MMDREAATFQDYHVMMLILSQRLFSNLELEICSRKILITNIRLQLILLIVGLIIGSTNLDILIQIVGLLFLLIQDHTVKMKMEILSIYKNLIDLSILGS